MWIILNYTVNLSCDTLTKYQISLVGLAYEMVSTIETMIDINFILKIDSFMISEVIGTDSIHKHCFVQILFLPLYCALSIQIFA